MSRPNSIFGEYGRGRSSTGNEVVGDQPYFTEPRPGKSGKCRVRAFHYPGHEEPCDKLCNSPFLANCYQKQCWIGFSLGPVPSSPYVHMFSNSEAAFQALQFWDDAVSFEDLSGEGARRWKDETTRTADSSYAGFGSSWAAMKAVLSAKFSPHSHMATQLKMTGDDFLLYYNADAGRDSIWSDNGDGTGQNWLGLQLMLVRDELNEMSDVPGSWTSNFIDKPTGKPSPRSESAWQATVQRANEALRKLIYEPPSCNFPSCSKAAQDGQQGYCCKAHRASHQHLQNMPASASDSAVSIRDNAGSSELALHGQSSEVTLARVCSYLGCNKPQHKAHPGFCSKMHRDRNARDSSSTRKVDQDAENGASTPAVASRPCEKFSLNMQATQFGMCHCGFDKKAHEDREQVVEDGMKMGQTPSTFVESPSPRQVEDSTDFQSNESKSEPSKSPRLFQSIESKSEPNKSPTSSEATKTIEAAATSSPSKRKPMERKSTPPSKSQVAPSQKGHASKILSEDEALVELQNMIRIAGFSPGVTGVNKFDCLPRIVRDAVSSIMSFGAVEEEGAVGEHELSRLAAPEADIPNAKVDIEESLSVQPAQLDKRFAQEVDSPQFGPQELTPLSTSGFACDPTLQRCEIASASRSRLDSVEEDVPAPWSNSAPAPASSFAELSIKAQSSRKSIFSFSEAEHGETLGKESIHVPFCAADDREECEEGIPGEDEEEREETLAQIPDSISRSELGQLPGNSALGNSTAARTDFSAAFVSIGDDSGSPRLAPPPSTSEQEEVDELAKSPPQSRKVVVSSQQVMQSVAPIKSQSGGGPCDKFSVDLSSAQFGMCHCGFAKSAHAKVDVGSPERDVVSPKLRSMIRPDRSAPSSPATEQKRDVCSTDVGASSLQACGPCNKFQLDTTAAQFGVCRCGFSKQAHSDGFKPLTSLPTKNVNSPAKVGLDSTRQDASTSPDMERLSLEQLKEVKRSGNYQGLDPSKLECYLEEAEFSSTFGTSLPEFLRLPPWKREQAKKKAGIF